ncbi:MAG: hypothetical protein AM324_008735 [Candidatus Thorarchaeota archaeon SMTZ1-83]|nr:MAG: hypothetical protein AM324_10120 [Candidatus Thorarchaeota archaeon SMTZ1-83]
MARSVKKAWWALSCIFAALQMVIVLFPATLPIGGTGGYFSIDLVSAPFIGYLLGPLYGTVSVLLGTFIAFVVDPSAAGVLGTIASFIPAFPWVGAFIAGIVPATSAFVAGRIRTGRYRAVPLVFILLIVFFLLTPVGPLALSFLWLHIVALVLSVLILVPRFKKHLESGLSLSDDASVYVGAITIWLLVFISVVADHLVASVMRAYLFFAVPPTLVLDIYTAVIIIYPIERIIASLIGGFIIVLLATTLTRANLHLPTRAVPEEEDTILVEASSQESQTLPDKAWTD